MHMRACTHKRAAASGSSAAQDRARGSPQKQRHTSRRGTATTNQHTQPRGEVHDGATHAAERQSAGSRVHQRSMQGTRCRASKEQAAAKPPHTHVCERNANAHADPKSVLPPPCRHGGHDTRHGTTTLLQPQSQSPKRGERQSPRGTCATERQGAVPSVPPAGRSRRPRGASGGHSRSFSEPPAPTLQQASQGGPGQTSSAVRSSVMAPARASPRQEQRRSGRPPTAQSPLQAAPARSSRRSDASSAHSSAATQPKRQRVAGQARRPNGRTKARRDPQESKGRC